MNNTQTERDQKLKELLGEYWFVTFERTIAFLEKEYKSTISEDALLSKSMETAKQIQQLELSDMVLVEMYQKLDDYLNENKKKKRIPAHLLSMLIGLHLDHFEGIEANLDFLLKSDISDETLSQCIKLLFHVIVLHYSNEDELEANFMELCEDMPSDFQLAPVLWHLYNEDVNYETLLTLASLADAKKPLKHAILGFKGFIYYEVDQPLEALYTYIVILHLIREHKKGAEHLGITYFLIAQCFYEIKNVPMTIEYCSKGIQEAEKREQPENLCMMYYLRAEALLEQEEKEKAKADLDSLLRIDPENEDGKELMKEI